MNELDEAETALRRAIEIDSNHAPAWNNLGNLQKFRNLIDEAETSYRRAIEIDPNFARRWLNLGDLLCHLKRFEEAEEALEKAISLDQKDPFPRLILAQVKKSQGSYKAAEEQLSKAIELGATEPSVWDRLGNLLADQLDRAAEAESAYRHAIERKPDALFPRANLAYLLIHPPCVRVVVARE